MVQNHIVNTKFTRPAPDIYKSTLYSNAESAVIDELGEWNGARDRPRAPRDWTREAYPTGNGNVAGIPDGKLPTN